MTEGADLKKAPPALFEHCVTTYKAMLAEAKAVTPQGDLTDLESIGLDEGDPEKQIIIYEGFFTRLVTSQLNLSVPYYTFITKQLIKMGCIRQLKRGGGTSPSQWELIYEPTLEAFRTAEPKKTKKPSRDAMFQEQLDNFNARLTDVEATLVAVLEALAEQFGTSEVAE